MQDVSKQGLPLVLVTALIMGVVGYAVQIESRFTKGEQERKYLMEQVMELKDDTKSIRLESIDIQKQNLAIYTKLNENLTTFNQRLVVLETVIKERR